EGNSPCCAVSLESNLGLAFVFEFKPQRTRVKWIREIKNRSCRIRVGRAICRKGVASTLTISSAALPAHPWDAPWERPSAAPPADSPLTRNTTSPDGPRHQSALASDCAAAPPPAGSSFPGPAAEKSSRTSGKP